VYGDKVSLHKGIRRTEEKVLSDGFYIHNLRERITGLIGEECIPCVTTTTPKKYPTSTGTIICKKPLERIYMDTVNLAENLT